MMRFSPAVERATGKRGTWRARKEEWGERSRIKVLLWPAFATAFASLLRSHGTMTNPRRHCDRPGWGKAQEREENVERNSMEGRGEHIRGRKANSAEGCGLTKREYAERVGVRVGWRSLATDYMDHCARTTASAHVEVKEDRARKGARYFCTALGLGGW